MIRVSDLYCHPIKSCAGTRLDSSELTRFGLAHDRMLMLVDANSRFLTQREFGQLCLVQPAIVDDGVTVSAPGMSDLHFVPSNTGALVRTEVWGTPIDTAVQSADVNNWFSDFLRTDVRLVTIREGFERRIDPQYATCDTDVVSFADGYSLLLLSQESLDGLNQRLTTPVGIDRFRPNIVVCGATPHAEDTWKSLTIGSARFSGVKPCARCGIVAVDPSTGEREKQPTATLVGYRTFEKGVMFGMNLIHHETGLISVGDEVQIRETHEPGWLS